jgi:CRP-like cAMP-binding protein
MFVILHGSVDVRNRTKEGKDETINSLFDGYSFGEMSLIGMMT